MRTRMLKYMAMMLLLAAGCKRQSDEIMTPLHRAVANGNVNEVELLLRQGVDVDAKDFSGKTPLLIAASQWHKATEMVPLLLDNGAYINASDKWGYSVLHKALQNPEPDIAELLLARGADVRTQSQDGETPLHEAARRGWTKLVKLLIAKGADVNVAARNGDTPLLSAMIRDSLRAFDTYRLEREHLEVARFLIAKGADVNAMNRAGETALSWAAQSGDLDLAQLLLDSGAQPNRARATDRAPATLAMNRDHLEMVSLLIARGADVTLHLAAYVGDFEKARALIQSGSDANARGQAGETPLHMAACGGHRDIVELLIGSGADVNAQAAIGWTPLHEAAWRGHEDIMELLVARGAAVSAKTTEDYRFSYFPRAYAPGGTTPLHFAPGDVAEVLIANGADINARDENGDTPVRRAASVGDRQVVDLLVAKGADISPHLAAWTGHAENVRRLIEAGADINTRDEQEHTPIYLAVLGGHADIVEMLASHGADPNERHTDAVVEDETLLHKAAQFDFEDVAGVLIAHGADIHARDRAGNTPLHSAAYCGSAHAARMLLVHGADPNARTDEGKTALDYAQEAGFADLSQLLGGDPKNLKAGPYRIMITDPNEVRRLVRYVGMDVDAVWLPDESQLKEFEAALRPHLLEESVLPGCAHESLPAHVRRFHRECSGFVYRGRKYILCKLNLGDLNEKPPDNRFSEALDAWWPITMPIYDIADGTFVRIHLR